MVRSGNIFANLTARLAEEEITILANHPGAVVERILSSGQASPPGFWYDQDWTEWVILLQGAATLLIEGEAAPRTLRTGDHVELPAHVRHRVGWTDPDQSRWTTRTRRVRTSGRSCASRPACTRR
jgi:cupin 2 domain-containing protein